MVEKDKAVEPCTSKRQKECTCFTVEKDKGYMFLLNLERVGHFKVAL